MHRSMSRLRRGNVHSDAPFPTRGPIVPARIAPQSISKRPRRATKTRAGSLIQISSECLSSWDEFDLGAAEILNRLGENC
jgi:hypothetical protein